jgi:hypothetical protein
MSAGTPRGNPSDGAPWCWIEKDVLRLIREKFEPRSRVHAIATTAALAELASDKQENPFTEKTAVIAHRAGYSYRKCFSILKTLEEIGIIRIDQRKVANSNIDCPSQYTLLSLCTACTPPSTACTLLCTDVEHAFRADRLEESEKNQRRKKEQTVASLRRLFIDECNHSEEFADAIVSLCSHYLDNLGEISTDDILTYLSLCGNDRKAEYGFTWNIFEAYQRNQDQFYEFWIEMWCIATNAYMQEEISREQVDGFRYDIKQFVVDQLETERRGHQRLTEAQERALTGSGKDSS